MIDRIPSGTRDVLPDEMRELRGMTDRIRSVFEQAGYGEVATPALEYESTFNRADTSGSRPAYRVFDEEGNVLVLRADMTVPIARLVATRYAHDEPPLRFAYFAHAYRGVRPQRGQSREFLQAGRRADRLAGLAGDGRGPQGALCGAGRRGLRNYRVGLGDASLYPSLLEALGAPPERRERILAALAAGDFVHVERQVRELDVDEESAALLLRVPRTRGGPEVFADLEGALHDALTGMRDVLARLAPDVAERIIFDLGLVRSIGYYTGAVFQVYDPAYGLPLGSGGRYDELLGTFGRPLPAVGFALNVERLHIALTGEERGRSLRGRT